MKGLKREGDIERDQMNFLKNIYIEIKNDFKKKIFIIFLILIFFEGVIVSITSLWIVNQTLVLGHISSEIIDGILFRISIAKFALFIFSIVVLSIILNYLLLRRVDPSMRARSIQKNQG
ncbi:MAG: hypothetical protein HQK49_00460 [Oligoflexia bacterium]|nr:hypothetical protein [Oligoflexia bacterium]